MNQIPVVILDYGSQYTQLIARRVRELGIFSKIFPANVSLETLASLRPQAVVLSGGPASVYDPKAPKLPEGFLEYQAQAGFAVLGICYGMQLLMQHFGGKVAESRVREYGNMPLLVEGPSSLFPVAGSSQVWMSHGDETQVLGSGFKTTACSETGVIAAVENECLRIFGLQFHPEVTHTQDGNDLLNRFFQEIAGIAPSWNMEFVIETQIQLISEKVGSQEHLICALSGGVDSAVAALLVHRAVGDRLHCFFVDHGLLRFEEQKRVMECFKQYLGLPVLCLNHQERYAQKLRSVVDPEEKRKVIGAEFIASFEEAAGLIARDLGCMPAFLVQGTLYPDVIESSAGHQYSALIKSHHNVGGLPKKMRFQLVEPLRDLFKDEVRSLGKKLGVPEAFLRRHPFPGPGLAVRVLQEVTPEALDILRKADEIFLEMIIQEGLYDRIWQAFAVFLPVQSVGVQGDGRVHASVIALRAVCSEDGMTAGTYPFDWNFLTRVASRICNEVKGVSRVVYDITSKPPATIEWE